MQGDDSISRKYSLHDENDVPLRFNTIHVYYGRRGRNYPSLSSWRRFPVNKEGATLITWKCCASTIGYHLANQLVSRGSGLLIVQDGHAEYSSGNGWGFTPAQSPPVRSWFGEKIYSYVGFGTEMFLSHPRLERVPCSCECTHFTPGTQC